MSTILTIDIGNTAVKAALHEGERQLRYAVAGSLSAEPVEAMLASSPVDGVAICSVRDDDDAVRRPLAGLRVPVVSVTPEIPLPIEMDYNRHAIGPDRVAAACGVAAEGKATLVVDAGTAVTADLVHGTQFVGGNISPGLRLRFRSLHSFTSRLPLVGPDGRLPQFGFDTESAIRSGVMRGLAAEILAEFNAAKSIFKDLSLILTGGDAAIMLPLLAGHGLYPEVDSDVVGRGLVRIFNYNVSL